MLLIFPLKLIILYSWTEGVCLLLSSFVHNIKIDLSVLWNYDVKRLKSNPKEIFFIFYVWFLFNQMQVECDPDIIEIFYIPIFFPLYFLPIKEALLVALDLYSLLRQYCFASFIVYTPSWLTLHMLHIIFYIFSVKLMSDCWFLHAPLDILFSEHACLLPSNHGSNQCS
jgi:hypothetical protein